MKIIHVIEDEPSILEAILMMLAMHHFDGEGYPNGLHLVDGKFRVPHLFLIDCELPKFTGIEICKHLKLNSIYSLVPVVLMSAQRRFESISKEVGAVAFLNKPFDMKVLISKIKDHLGSPE